ncbi:MAG: omega-6 fatty acid desaturase (delta-12 desaturase) [Myxococcota bacterium]|jgi:omega-6 fatty acid desaturase (delta-12 desaturase)
MSSTLAETAETVIADAPEWRSGPALVRATKPYTQENRARSWWELLSSLTLLGAALSVCLLAPLWAKLIAVVFAGLILIRTFIIFHDTVHGAMFTKSRPGHWIMNAFGFLILSPAPIWKESHDYHHKNNCRLPSTSIGSYPVVTTRLWRRMSKKDQRAYRFARSPLTMAFGYLTIFLGQMCAQSFMRNPKLHWQSLASPIVHVGLFVGLGLIFGWVSALFTVILPLVVSHSLGSYLFYAQHNAPGIYFAPRTAWKYDVAALKSSTMFDMPAVMHYFTGNIGYHHVHHLNHRIPFYRLPEAMAGIPELQDPIRTNWRPSSMMAALRLKLWDPNAKEMVPLPEPKAT